MTDCCLVPHNALQTSRRRFREPHVRHMSPARGALLRVRMARPCLLLIGGTTEKALAEQTQPRQ